MPTTDESGRATALGAAFGFGASLVFPAYIMLVPNPGAPRSWTNAVRAAWPYWAVTLPGALVAGILLGVLIQRSQISGLLTVGAGLVVTVLNAGVGGVLNFAFGNPCRLNGAATHSIPNAFAGGLLGFVMFFFLTIPIAVGTSLGLRLVISEGKASQSN